MEVFLVDCNYVEHEFAASYLLKSKNEVGEWRGVFVECNTSHAIPYLKKFTEDQGLSVHQIDALIVTHIHLDHAGGAGEFLKTFPNSKVWVHPRGVKHLIDPSKLIASATQVYGASAMAKLYGEILPCASERVISVEDQTKWNWGGSELYFKHTRGHANHHFCLWEPKTKTVFTGDSFGVSYPLVNRKRGMIISPSTSPTDFHGESAHETVDWVVSMKPSLVALTHFGFLSNEHIASAQRQLHDHLRFSESMVSKIQRERSSLPLAEKLTEKQVSEHLHDWFIQYYANQNIHLDSEDLKLYSFDFKINAQGLLFAAQRGMT